MIIYLDGNTRSVDITNPEHSSSKNVHTSCYDIIHFNTELKLRDFLSLTGKNMIPTTIANVEKDTCFQFDHCEYIEKNQIEEGTFLNPLWLSCVKV